MIGNCISLWNDNQIIPQLFSNQTSSYFTFSYANEMHQNYFESSVMLQWIWEICFSAKIIFKDSSLIRISHYRYCLQTSEKNEIRLMPTMQILTTLVPKLNEVFSAYAQFKTTRWQNQIVCKTVVWNIYLCRFEWIPEILKLSVQSYKNFKIRSVDIKLYRCLTK